MEKQLKIIITGDNGECLPPPYGGIPKRCLLHAKIWRELGAKVYMQVHHKHANENDLGARAEYFYDYAKPPTAFDKIFLVLGKFLSRPWLFTRLIFLQLRLDNEAYFGRYLYCAAKAIILDKKIKDVKPDVIVTETGGLQSLMSLEIGKRNGLPVILENYAEIQFKPDEKNENIAGRQSKLWKYLVNGVDLVVPASKHCTKGPLKYLTDPDKMKVIYSGINFDIFNGRALDDKPAARKKFNLPEEKFLVMAVGALKMRKGHDQLFEAILKIPKEKLKKMAVVLCGMGDIPELRKRAEELNFPADSLFVFQGLTEEDLARLYSSVDCFCFPSITPRECMGMAMKEAMAIGLPIVAYDTGGISEAITPGENGLLAPTGDREALARGNVAMLNMPAEERKRMGQNNIEKARKVFDIKVTAKELLDEIFKLARKDVN